MTDMCKSLGLMPSTQKILNCNNVLKKRGIVLGGYYDRFMGHLICYSNCDTFENGRGLLVIIHYTRDKVPQEHRGALIKKRGTSGPGQWARRLTGKMCLTQ